MIAVGKGVILLLSSICGWGHHVLIGIIHTVIGFTFDERHRADGFGHCWVDIEVLILPSWRSKEQNSAVASEFGGERSESDTATVEYASRATSK